jgi:hypothetical protein
MTSEEGARRIFGTDPLGDTVTAMTELDEIGSLTRGEKPLYHIQLCPDAKYPVTDEQFKRMAEIVIESVGAKGHDYELYYHIAARLSHAPACAGADAAVERESRQQVKPETLLHPEVTVQCGERSRRFNRRLRDFFF